MMTPLLRFCTLVFFSASFAAAADKSDLLNLPYKSGDSLSSYEKQRCLLDVYLPKEGKEFATLVWFHGGGLTGGNKDADSTKKVARGLAQEGVAVVVPNYRLSPQAKYPAYIEDATAAVAWTLQNIAKHGGDTKRVFVGGHSAGGYLTLMLGMDAHYLAAFGLKPQNIAGFIPVSGQVMTHYTVREERGISKFSVTADEAAPVRYADVKNLPPMLVLCADTDMPARAEENVYLVALMKGAGNKRVTLQVIANRNHGSVGNNIANEGDPAREAILKFMQGEK
ncbi:alpha/beta hydrolase [Prosthecobacter sp.]|uniref:alpha/beta hydrolase n=1 Tax=Prosthecobacter sp. TaxID=1965333 RepID=UPI0037838CE4